MVTKGLMVWQGSLGSLVRGDFLDLTDPLDQLDPRVSQVLQVALEGQGWQEPSDRKVTWGFLGSLA